jgi:hypothetical protein
MALDEGRGAHFELDLTYVSPKNVYKNDLKQINKDAKKMITDETHVKVIGEYLDKEGNHWCWLADNAWVKVTDRSSGYVTNEGEVTENSRAIGTAVVTTNGYLNIRQEAGTDHKIVGALAKSDSVKVYEIKTVNGHRWGRINAGWICLTYTNLTLLEDANISDEGMKLYAFTGVMKNGSMAVRVAAGDHTNLAEYTVPHATNPKGDKGKETLVIPQDTAVTILEVEQQTLDPHRFPDPDAEYPTHFTAMTFTLAPDFSHKNFRLQDCGEGDSVRRKTPDGATAVGIIGGASAPMLMIRQSKERPYIHTTCSALRFDAGHPIQWEAVFYEKLMEDMEVELL